jgi:ABC-type multidrug transport system permease subunit
MLGIILGAIYFVLIITFGVLSIRKGHWVMFIIGIFLPLFWIIGALLPDRRRVAVCGGGDMDR